jgi:DNA-binding transcriptional ArsR family regulator
VLVYAHDNVLPAHDDLRHQRPDDRQIEVAVTALRMLADPTRLRLLWLLRDGEYDVSTLTAATGAARPAVSQHLAKLRLAGLVTVRRDGRPVPARTRCDRGTGSAAVICRPPASRSARAGSGCRRCSSARASSTMIVAWNEPWRLPVRTV